MFRVKSNHNMESFNKKVMVVFFVLVCAWLSFAGLIALTYSQSFEVLILSYSIIGVLGLIPMFYVTNRFFKDAMSQFGAKKFQTCIFQGLEAKREAYLDQLTKEMARIGFKRVNRSTLGFISPAFGDTELIFASDKGTNGIGVRAVSVNDDLKIGFVINVIKMGRYFATSIPFIFLGAFASFIPFIGLSAQDIERYVFSRYIFIGYPLFIIIACIPLIYTTIYRERYSGKIRRLLVETAQSLGGKQVAPFEKTTVKL